MGSDSIFQVKAGAATVALPRLSVEALRYRKKEQAQERLLLGRDYQDHGLVLARADGSPWKTRFVY